MIIVSGSANPALSERISKEIGQSLTKVDIHRFADGEIYAEIQENVRGEDVFVIQPTSTPVNENLMELLVLIDALRRGSARRITAVIPYYGYARQDRKTSPRSPITAKLVANLVEKAGANRLLTLDLHSGQIQGFFEIPADNLLARPEMVRHITETIPDADKALLVSPDVGGVARARDYARLVNDSNIVIVDKRRPKPGVAEAINVIGNPEGLTCILVDDIVDSAGSLCSAANVLMARGARQVYAYVTHGVLSHNAAIRVANSPIERLVITDTIALAPPVQKVEKISVVSIAPLLAEAIRRIHVERSVSSLFI